MNPPLLKPQVLRRGDTVAVLSLSWGGASLFPEVFDHGLDFLRSKWGLKIKEYPTTRLAPEDLYRNPRARAADLQAAFADPEVKAIIASIGGDDSIRLFEFLEVEKLLAQPKILLGFSDTTTLLAGLNLFGLVTYYGNSVMAGFAYLAGFPEAAAEYEQVLFTGAPYEIKPFPVWADHYRPWGDKANVGLTGPLQTDDVGHRWLQKSAGPVTGPLWGGCLEVLSMMNGTRLWPQPDFWNGRILLLETSEDKPTPTQVGYFLRNLGVQGVWSRVAGLLFAKPKAYSAEEKAEVEAEILKIVVGEFGASHLPIVSNVEFGHTDPRHILPLGIKLTLDPREESLRFAETLLEPRG